MAKSLAIDKPWTHMEVEHVQGSGTTNLYPANIGVVGHESEVRDAQTLLGEMSYWDDIPPKRGKDELESLCACHER